MKKITAVSAALGTGVALLVLSCSPRRSDQAGTANSNSPTSSLSPDQPGSGETNQFLYVVQTSERSFSPAYLEAEPQRVRIDIDRSATPDVENQEATAFRITNPGDRDILIWNVRVQVRDSDENGGGDNWITVHNDYPDGSPEAKYEAGESALFWRHAPDDRPWRVCLLYSRDVPEPERPAGSGKKARGSYEVISPVVE